MNHFIETVNEPIDREMHFSTVEPQIKHRFWELFDFQVQSYVGHNDHAQKHNNHIDFVFPNFLEHAFSGHGSRKPKT